MEKENRPDQKDHSAASGECPFTHHKDSAITTTTAPGGTTNKEWWPNMLNLEHPSPA